MTDLDALLKLMVDAGGTDLVIKAGSPPTIRVGGGLKAAEAAPPDPATLFPLLEAIAPRARVQELVSGGETEFAHGVPGVGRFRICAFRQRGTLAITCHRVMPGLPSPAELGLPSAVDRVCAEGAGLVLVTGPAGSGVTTTLCALVDHVNSSRSCQIVTVEDPIEYFHPDKQSVVLQREVGTDTASVATGVRRALRQGAEVLAVGSVPDAAALRTVLDAAEAGALVFAVLPALSADEALVRFMEAFGEEERRRARAALGAGLRAVFGQRLLERADGSGRIAAFEVLFGTSKVEDCIAEDRLGDLNRIVAEGTYHGMRTLDGALEDLVREGLVAARDAAVVARDPDGLQLSLGRFDASWGAEDVS